MTSFESIKRGFNGNGKEEKLHLMMDHDDTPTYVKGLQEITLTRYSAPRVIRGFPERVGIKGVPFTEQPHLKSRARSDVRQSPCAIVRVGVRTDREHKERK